MRNLYRAYGLTLGSLGGIPGLEESTGSPKAVDLNFSWGKEPDWVRQARCMQQRPLRIPSAAQEGETTLRITEYGDEQFFGFTYADGTEFVLDSHATRLWGACPPPLVLEDLATYLVGPVMGYVLRRRGFTTLHACSVVIEGKSIAVCGGGGAGKSTTAAALALKGMPVLCEDVSPLVESEGEFQIPPGYPRVCLWPHSVELLFGTCEALPRITPTWEKRYLALDGERARFAGEPKPLAAVYFLETAENGSRTPRLEELKPGEALLELVKNSYMNRLLSKDQRAEEFDVLSRLTTSVTFRRLIRSAEEQKLDALCDLILGDAVALTATRHGAAASSLR